jgi:hypothetical protein
MSDIPNSDKLQVTSPFFGVNACESNLSFSDLPRDYLFDHLL